MIYQSRVGSINLEQSIENCVPFRRDFWVLGGTRSVHLGHGSDLERERGKRVVGWGGMG